MTFLTDPDDLVLDIFSGSNTTGHAAEASGRRWLSIDIDRSSAMLSAVRFMEDWDEQVIQTTITGLENGTLLDLTTGAGPKKQRAHGAVGGGLA